MISKYKKRLRNMLLSFSVTREILFFVFRKKVYKKNIDRKITFLIKSKRKISKKRMDNLIVSLTSFPQRIEEVKYTVYSLLDQTLLPERIILWLSESQFPNKEHDLPEELLALKSYGFNISWCEDIKSYKKLIPALEQFPDYYIATADDDIYYERRWLEKLWNEHISHPENLVCHIAHKLLFDDGKILPYMKWKRCIKKGVSNFQNFGCGCGGILYHKKYLYEDIERKELFLRLAPNADDIWFYFMAVLGKTPVRIVKNPCSKVKYVNPYREYGLNREFKLSSLNVEDNRNDEQFKNILDYYHLDLYSLLNNHES